MIDMESAGLRVRIPPPRTVGLEAPFREPALFDLALQTRNRSKVDHQVN